MPTQQDSDDFISDYDFSSDDFTSDYDYDLDYDLDHKDNNKSKPVYKIQTVMDMKPGNIYEFSKFYTDTPTKDPFKLLKLMDRYGLITVLEKDLVNDPHFKNYYTNYDIKGLYKLAKIFNIILPKLDKHVTKVDILRLMIPCLPNRFDNLPVEILHLIVSYLEIEDVCQISILNKTYYHLFKYTQIWNSYWFSNFSTKIRGRKINTKIAIKKSCYLFKDIPILSSYWLSNFCTKIRGRNINTKLAIKNYKYIGYNICYMYRVCIYASQYNANKFLKMFINGVDDKYILNQINDNNFKRILNLIVEHQSIEVGNLILKYRNYKLDNLDKLFVNQCYKDPLIYYIINNNVDMVKYLVNNGINTNVNYGKNPLCIAIIYNLYEICRFLLDKGANINIIYDYKTPLELAQERGYKKLVKLIENYINS